MAVINDDIQSSTILNFSSIKPSVDGGEFLLLRIGRKVLLGPGNKGILSGLENLKKQGAVRLQITLNYFRSYLFYNRNRSMNSAPLPSPRGGAVPFKLLLKSDVALSLFTILLTTLTSGCRGGKR